MLVRNQNRGKRLRIFPERLHALESFAARNAGVDEDFCPRAGHERTIPFAAAGQHRNRYTHAREHTRLPCELGVTFPLSDTLGWPGMEVWESGLSHPILHALQG